MPDWKEVVRENLGPAGLPPSAEEDVIAELATHLEELCEHEQTRGRSELEAEKWVLANIRWQKLAREIRAAKREEESMKNRKRTLLLPTFANLLLLTLGILALGFLGFHPEIDAQHHVWFSFPIPWLLALPFVGAAGTLLAKREGASPAERLVAGLAPSVVWLAEFCLMAVAIECDRHDFAPFPPQYFGLTALWWVVLPVLAQLAGTLPFIQAPEKGDTGWRQRQPSTR